MTDFDGTFLARGAHGYEAARLGAVWNERKPDRHPDALLLGSNALWGANRYSCFAGFAEAGESLESAVLREVREESGVAVQRSNS